MALGSRNSSVPHYVRQFQSVGVTETEKLWRRRTSAAAAGTQGGMASALFAGIGELGKRLIEKDHQDRVAEVTKAATEKGLAAGDRAALEGVSVQLRKDDTLAAEAFNEALKSGYIGRLDVLTREKADQIAREHATDPDGFNSRWASMREEVLAGVPQEWQHDLDLELERRRVQRLRPIADGVAAEALDQANADIGAAQDKYLSEAEVAARAGRTDDAAGNAKIFGEYLNRRTDLSPQQKAQAKADLKRSLRRHHVLGEFERLADEDPDTAGAFIDNLDERAGIIDPDEQDSLKSEMRRDLARRKRERSETLRAGADEAERVARNGIARIEAGEVPDPSAEAKVRGLAGDEAGADYRRRATRATNRRTAFETLSAMPPDEAWATWNATKPDPKNKTFADDMEDWQTVGRTLKQSHDALARDPAAAVAEGVRREIETKQAPGGPLAGADDAEIADAMAEATLRRQRELGVRTPRLLRKDQTDAIKDQWDTAGAKDRLALLGSLQSQYGGRWNRVLGELEDAGLPPEAGHAAAAQDPATARLILEGAEVRKFEPQFVPSSDSVFRDAMNRLLPPEVLEGFSPEFAKGLNDTVLSVYAAKAKEAGDAGKLANQDRLKASVEAVTGGVVRYDRPGLGGGNPKTLAPMPGMDSDGFTKLIDGLTDDDLGSVFTRQGGAVTIDEIRESGEFQALGSGKYALAIEGTPLFGADGGPAIIDLGALARTKGGK